MPKIVEEIRRIEGKPDLLYNLIGHSVGGQFLVRLSAFEPGQAGRIIAANPGSDLFPVREMDDPYGFGKLPPGLSGDDQLRKYLAAPLTLYLGTADTVRDGDLDSRPEADRQGNSRLERGRNAFKAALTIAAEKGWPFGRRLVEAGGVGHNPVRMFNHPATREAMMGGGPIR